MDLSGDLSKLKVVDLKAALAERNLDTKGIKAVLVSRLEAALAAESNDSPGEFMSWPWAQIPRNRGVHYRELANSCNFSRFALVVLMVLFITAIPVKNRILGALHSAEWKAPSQLCHTLCLGAMRHFKFTVKSQKLPNFVLTYFLWCKFLTSGRPWHREEYSVLQF